MFFPPKSGRQRFDAPPPPRKKGLLIGRPFFDQSYANRRESSAGGIQTTWIKAARKNMRSQTYEENLGFALCPVFSLILIRQTRTSSFFPFDRFDGREWEIECPREKIHPSGSLGMGNGMTPRKTIHPIPLYTVPYKLPIRFGFLYSERLSAGNELKIDPESSIRFGVLCSGSRFPKRNELE